MTGSFKTLRRILNMGKPAISKIFLGLILLAVGYLTINTACRNPNDFKPPEDTLNQPPAPPQLLSPIDYYVRMPDAPTGRLLLTWEAIKDAELYEIFFTSDSHGQWTVSYDTNCFSMRLEKEPWQYLIDKFTWKVRAFSSLWQYSTDWSEPRHFEVRFKPPPPDTLLPSNDTNFIFDSLPAEINFAWNRVQDEQYYDVNVSLDTILVFERRIFSNSYQTEFSSAGIYFWKVRAGSALWQYSTDWSITQTFHISISKHQVRKP
jgi:hypothetical protein